MRAELVPLVAQWRREAPDRAAPWEETSALLEASGNVRVAGVDRLSAIDAMRRAWRLARPGEAARDARELVRLLLRAGDFREVAQVAQTALAAAGSRDLDELDFLLPIAVVTGRVRTGTMLLERVAGLRTRRLNGPDGSPVNLTPELSRARAAFVVSAALGVCDDQVRNAPVRLAELADVSVPRASRPAWFDVVLVQEPLELAQDCTGPGPLARLAGAGRWTNRAATLLLSGDTAAVRTLLASMGRAGMPPDAPPMAPELAVTEALVRAAVGDSVGAMAVLKRSLDGLSSQTTRIFMRETSMGSIGRGMLLLAEWSIGRDAASARRWLDAVSALWSGADASLRADVARVRRKMEAAGN